ncbi:hypothetical protein BKA67DRAFT_664528 [Truncatella angustata]|uniref:Uncharacterized protein n=1 Tax=Truncatella angustata TaxID=152316 RepID=A0A9P8U8Q8_9PEZI|nr:uncharacterized protein BKA67DRAFT_664528 [Truncatella angustata]KAH6645454.1 hypothetical protein BKA67DRAFT_664528 [Truncatella angustata]KAH8200901.1 hypothetical protein TruAng_004910 [Truncatella angustata]
MPETGQPAQDPSRPVQHQKPQFRHLFAFTTWRHSLFLAPALVASVFASVLRASLAVLVGRIFGLIASHGRDALSAIDTVAQVSTWCTVLVIVGSIGWIIHFALMFSWLAFGDLQAQSARQRILGALLHRDLNWYDRQVNGTAVLLARTQTQLRDLQSTVCIVLGNLSVDFLTTGANLVVAFFYSWQLTLVILATLPPSIFILKLLSRKLQPAMEVQKQELSLASKHAISAIAAIDIVKAFSGTDQETWQYSAAIKRSTKAFLVQSRASACQMAYMKFWLEIIFVIGFYYGALLAKKGMDPGSVVTAFYATCNALQAIESVAPLYIMLAKGISAGQTLQHISNHVKPSGITKKPVGNETQDECDGAIRFHKVSFAYSGNPRSLVLAHKRLYFPGRQLSFLIGPSGAGKSTAADLLVKFYEPYEGDITIGGVSLKILDDDWIRRNIILLQQDGVLFDDTFLANITMGIACSDKANRASIDAVCDATHLQSTIADMPNGVRTRVGNFGHNLSGGQAQRLFLARALIRNPEVLILDEPTSGLDSPTRTLVMEAVRAWRNGKTTIVITHDLTQIRSNDHVCVLDKKRDIGWGLRHKMETAYKTSLADLLTSDNASISKAIVLRCSDGVGLQSQTPSPEHLQAEPQVSIPPLSATLWPCIASANSKLVSGRLRFGTGPTTAQETSRGTQQPSRTHKSPVQMDSGHSTKLLPDFWRHQYRTGKETLDQIIDLASSKTTAVLKAPTHCPDAPRKISRTPLRDTIIKDIPMLPPDVGRTSLTMLQEQAYSVRRLRTRNGDHVESKKRATPRGSYIDTSNNGGIDIVDRDPSHEKCQSTENTGKIVSLYATYRTVWPLLDTKARCYLVIGLLNCVLLAASVPAFSIIFASLLSVLHLSVDSIPDSQTWALFLLLVAVVGATATFLANFLMDYCGQVWIDALRVEAISRIMRQPRPFFDKSKHTPNRIIECMDRNAEEIRSLVGRFAPGVLMMATMVLTTTIWAFIISWRLTLVALSTVPLLFGVVQGYAHVSNKWEVRYNVTAEATAAVMTEAITKLRVVRALSLEQHFTAKHDKSALLTYHVGLKKAAWMAVLFACWQALIWMVMAIIFYYATVLLAVRIKLTVDDMLKVVSLLVLGIGAASQMLGSIPATSSAQATAGRLIYYASLPVPGDKNKDNQSNESEYEDTRKDFTIKPKKKLVSPFPVRLDGVYYSYPSREGKAAHSVLSNLTLEISPGMTTAITGHSGCGKSTLASLLLLMREPTHIPQVRNVRPSIYRHPISFAGLPPELLDMNTLRNQIAFVPQQPVLFPLTIEKNITYGLPDTSPLLELSNIERAARQAGVLDFIDSLPYGFDTAVGEGGQALSGGQTQRICLARALVRRPKLLILDEPTSALDPEAAVGVRRTISRLIDKARGMPGLTPSPVHGRPVVETWDLIAEESASGRCQNEIAIVIITHNVEMMKVCDRLAVLDRGRIAEQGTFKDLLNKQGRLVQLIGKDQAPEGGER